LTLIRILLACLLLSACYQTNVDTENCDPMHDPDWDRYNVTSRAQDSTGQSHTPLGDPTRWGAVVNVTSQLIGNLQDLQSPQILRVQCSDNYSRPWAAVGTLRAPIALWNAGVPATPEVGNLWIAMLVVHMGVGQNTIVHQIDLRAVIAADAPFYVDDDQAVIAGFRQKAFVISGGLIGNAMSVNVRHVIRYFVQPTDPEVITTAVQLTAFNAGTGL
jgi:hypothetical protein